MTRPVAGSSARVLLGPLVAFALAACASGGRAFPTTGEAPSRTLGRAAAAVAEAVTAGADSLAPEPLKAARQHLAAATTEAQAKHADRAGLLAREAIADASYARAEAERMIAERARATAATQVDEPTAPSGSTANGASAGARP